MATTAFALLLLAALVALGAPARPLTLTSTAQAALDGVRTLSRLDARRRDRLRARSGEDGEGASAVAASPALGALVGRGGR
jgi:hypothetical protein